LLRRCLEKDLRGRLRDVGDARLDLEDAKAGASDDETTKQVGGVTRRTAIAALAGAAAGAAATGAFAIGRYRDATPRNLTRFAIATPKGEFFPASFNSRIGISRDGRRVAFNSIGPDGVRLYTRSLSELESRPIKEVVAGAAPFFSPDDRWMGFFVTNPTAMRKVP
jgi:serine/threonine-protein kinase